MENSEKIPNQFTLFPRLPAEIRLLIWNFACRVERIIPLLPGLGHLSPLTHPTLAVPPVLHACSDSRRVALKHYNLSFHPRLYVNHDYDHIMLHLFYPHQLISLNLYHHSAAAFNWDRCPPRLAALLDDASFYEPLEDEDDNENTTRRTDTPWRQRLRPVSPEFLVLLSPAVEELTLLILPPLTGRPNPTAHRFDLVNAPDSTMDADGASLTSEIHDRLREIWDLHDDDENTSEALLPNIRFRFATCEQWTSHSSQGLRNKRSAELYADLKLGKNPADPGVVLGFMDMGPRCREPRDERIRAIQRDMQMLREPFCRDTGLGPHAVWEREVIVVGPMRQVVPQNYRAHRRLLWPDNNGGDGVGAGERAADGIESCDVEEWTGTGTVEVLNYNGLFFWG